MFTGQIVYEIACITRGNFELVIWHVIAESEEEEEADKKKEWVICEILFRPT